ncbi:RICIN domain-containing protein [Dyella koreensis]|uniref:RICIN domain-containing protein n=1 Tax=Dyella koreensis TaxID=311235 RepID=A0ABW8K3G6_9GAMM
MAFSPGPNDYYYLVARHSGKVLSVANASSASGARIQQAEPADEKHQHFKFDAVSTRLFAIRVKHSDLVIDIDGAHTVDGANVIQAGWHNGANQRFRLVDAGDGYYFIEAEHSGKCLDVYGATATSGASVVQHQNRYAGDAHNQQFKPVLATSEIGLAMLPTFKRPLDYLREITIGGIGLIPTAGGAIKFVTAALWPDNSLQMVWDQITAYIDKLVESKLSAERITALKLALDGAKKNLDEYNGLQPGTEKAGYMNSVIATLNTSDRAFFRKEEPEKTATYLMTMGTLKLTLLRERALNYATIAKVDKDPNPDGHLASLKSAVAEYTKAALTFRAGLMERRLKFLSGVTRHEATRAQFIDYVVKDAADEREGRAATMYVWRVFPPFDREQQRTAETKLLPACKALVTAQYGAQLDAMFASARIWNSYIPGQAAPTSRTVRASVGPFGGGIGTATDLTQDKPIEGVRIYFDRRIRGIQAKHASGWGPLVGRAEGACRELLLKKDERIVSAYGQADGQLASASFETSFGASIRTSVPSADGKVWNADLPPELNATLVRISASPGEQGVEGITLHWEYAVLGDYPVALRGSAKSEGAAAKMARKKGGTRSVGDKTSR